MADPRRAAFLLAPLLLAACDSPKGACIETRSSGSICIEKRASRCTYDSSHESPPVFHEAKSCVAVGYPCRSAKDETFAKSEGGACGFGFVRAP